MRDEHYSRNRRLMSVLKTLGFVEEYGEGVDRMFREMEARLMTPPDIQATSSSVTVTIRNRFLVSAADQAWIALLADYPMTMDERFALVEARNSGSITRRRLRELLPAADAREVLAGAVAKGLLVRIGRGGGTRYVLSDEVVLRAGSEGMEAQRRRRQTLIDEIGRRGSLSTAEGARLLDEDMAAVRQLLNELASAGLVRAEGNTRARRYYPVAR
jgi:ATP-dependent DNA helicase RecG